LISDGDLIGIVADELFWDPRVHAEAIAVHARDGKVTLRGAVVRGDVLQALMLDALVPDTVDAKVKHGVVTLTGTAERQYQRDEAILIACSIVRALDVIDGIELKHPPRPDDVRELIERAWKGNAALEAKDLHIATSDLHIATSGGKVTIEGTVSSWTEDDEAIDAVWSAPDVTSVDDHLKIVY
jgi:osmotically-inducible protein OsmY